MDAELLHDYMLTCGFKATYGIDCMGCGFQRSVLALLNGDLSASISFYPALIPMVFLIAFLFAHLAFKFKFGAGVIKIWFGVTAAIAVINWFSNAIWPLILH